MSLLLAAMHCLKVVLMKPFLQDCIIIPGLLVRFPIQEETRKSFAASLQDFIIYLIFAYIYIISIGVLYVYITPINSISHIVQSLHKVEFKEI